MPQIYGGRNQSLSQRNVKTLSAHYAHGVPVRQFDVVTSFVNRDRRSNARAVQDTGPTERDNTQPLRGILCVVVCGGGKGWGIVPSLFRTYKVLPCTNWNCGQFGFVGKGKSLRTSGWSVVGTPNQLAKTVRERPPWGLGCGFRASCVAYIYVYNPTPLNNSAKFPSTPGSQEEGGEYGHR